MADTLLEYLFGHLRIWKYLSDRPSKMCNVYTLKQILQLRTTCPRLRDYMARHGLPPVSWTRATALLGSAHRSFPLMADSLKVSVPAVKHSLIRLWRSLFIAIEFAEGRLLPEQHWEFYHFLDHVSIHIRVRLAHLQVCNVVRNRFADPTLIDLPRVRFIPAAQEPIATRDAAAESFSALVGMTRDYAKIAKVDHPDLAPDQRRGFMSAPALGTPRRMLPAYHQDVQEALEGVRMEMWALAAALDLLPGTSATEWNSLTATTFDAWDQCPIEEFPSQHLADYVRNLAGEGDGHLRCRGLIRETLSNTARLTAALHRQPMA